MNKKTGVLLINLGTPEAPTTTAIKKYLLEFLTDNRVVEVKSKILWQILLRLIIVNIRAKKVANLYKKIWCKYGNGSPLLDISIKQQQLISNILGDNYTVSLGMRYGKPAIKDALSLLLQCKKIIILPLYPQYSSATTGSTFVEVNKELCAWRNIPELVFINSYHANKLYIKALADSIKDVNQQQDFLVISYHGIPYRYIKHGDIYAQHCMETTKLLVEELSLNDKQYQMCYQSRFGKEPWLQPYTDKTLIALAKKGIHKIKIVCPGFSADCLETIHEIVVENKDIFLTNGGKDYKYIKALNYRSSQINCLIDIVKQNS